MLLHFTLNIECFSAGSDEDIDIGSCSIPGLESRIDKPLKFLGLFKTIIPSCHRNNIPALSVAGSSNEDQLLLAATMYQECPTLLQHVLYKFSEILKDSSAKQIARVIDVVLVATEKKFRHSETQTWGAICLLHIITSQIYRETTLGPAIKNRIALALLKEMSYDRENLSFINYGCLTLLYIDLPNDLVRNDYIQLILSF